MPSPPYRGRFAPSPTGPLHAGSLFTAVASWLLARHARGQWLIRIEDVDRDRCVPGAAEHQLATLASLGLHSDGPVIRQSQRTPRYQQALDQLLAQGDAFYCGCSRAQLAATGGVHRHCVAPPRSDGHNAVRLHTAGSGVIGFDDQLQGPQRQDVSAEVGDVVLFRADGCWAYQLAVVVDDADQGITDVVRGADLLDSTARQIWLQRCLLRITCTCRCSPMPRVASCPNPKRPCRWMPGMDRSCCAGSGSCLARPKAHSMAQTLPPSGWPWRRSGLIRAGCPRPCCLPLQCLTSQRTGPLHDIPRCAGYRRHWWHRYRDL